MLLLTFYTVNTQAQTNVNSSDQTRTIEINNENGSLYISFVNDVIIAFLVNDKPVAKDRYSAYQDIIDDFSGVEEESHSPPVPNAPDTDDNQSERLHEALTAFLMNAGVIDSYKKYKVQLKRKSLEVNDKKTAIEIHKACLDIFNEIYGHTLNFKSAVKFRRFGENFISTVRIED